jgi:hypothetical protein
VQELERELARCQERCRELASFKAKFEQAQR